MDKKKPFFPKKPQKQHILGAKLGCATVEISHSRNHFRGGTNMVYIVSCSLLSNAKAITLALTDV